MKTGPRCSGCALEHLPGPVGADGEGSRGVLLVGEAPGENEAREGRPFIGAAGWQLESLLRRIGAERDWFRITNAVQCRPRKNLLVGQPFETDTLLRCQPLIEREVASFRPRAILAVGGIPLKQVTGASGITRYRGFVLDARWQDANGRPIPTIATFHPSFLLPRRGEQSTSKLTGIVLFDIRRVLAIAEQGFTRATTTYALDPLPQRAEQIANEMLARLEAGISRFLAFDIETESTGRIAEEDRMLEGAMTILRISFSDRPRTAMTVPFTAPWMGVIRRLLESPFAKVGWNSRKFDVPILAGAGITVSGQVHDAMNAWHVLKPSLPKGLEFVSSIFADHLQPWKHKSAEEPEWYSAVDADATICCMEGIEGGLRSIPLPELPLEGGGVGE